MTTASNIPAELRTLRQWVCSDEQKVPKQVDGGFADVSKPETWNSFDACVAAAAKHKGWGVTFCFTTGDPYTVVDFDHVRNAESGDTESWVLAIIDGLNSYTELSRSGTGWHVIVRSKRNALGKKTPHVEIYDHGKFVTLTGNVQPFVGSEEIFERDKEIAALQTRLEAEAKPAAAPASGGKSESEEDYKLICKILDETKATNAKALADEFAKRYPQRYEERNRVKKNRQGRPYIEYTALAVLRRLGLQSDPQAADEKPGSGPEGEKIWRDVFHTGCELDPTPGRVFIKGILEEGITSFGALSGVGKTWIGLSISHAITTGEKLFGVFEVLDKANVLYLVPEMGGRKFRQRMVAMRIPMDGRFFCQTITDGACNLEDPLLKAAIEDMRPVVILDTAIRFQTGEENSSTDQAQGLGSRIFKLIKYGAGAVICLHHRAKAARNEELNLENALRGSGDFGGFSDVVWAVEHARKAKGTGWDKEYTKESKNLTRLRLECVKPRDMDPADPFVIQGRPYIDQTGDFRVLATEVEEIEGHEESIAPVAADLDAKLAAEIKKDPEISLRKLCAAVGAGHTTVNTRVYKEGGKWKFRKVEPASTGELKTGFDDAY